MYLRGILVCLRDSGVGPSTSYRLIFQSSFAVAELKARQAHGVEYIPFSEVVDNVISGLSRLATSSASLFMSCPVVLDAADNRQLLFGEQYSPICALPLSDAKTGEATRAIWPIVKLEHGNICALALPLIESIDKPYKCDNGPLLGAAFELLISIVDYVQHQQGLVDDRPAVAARMLKQLSQSIALSCCPFGRIVSTDLYRNTRLLEAGANSEMLPSELDEECPRIPFFRPVMPAHKESIGCLIDERINSIQNSEAMPTSISGCCWLRAEITAASPSIVVPLCIPLDPATKRPLVKLFLSPSVNSVTVANESNNVRVLALSLIPPLDWFPLVLYETLDPTREPPLMGDLQIQYNNSVIKVTLRLTATTPSTLIDFTDLTTIVELAEAASGSSVQTSDGTIGTSLQCSEGEARVDSNGKVSLIWKLGTTHLASDMPSGQPTLKAVVHLRPGDVLIDPIFADIRFGQRFSSNSNASGNAVGFSGVSVKLSSSLVNASPKRRIRPKFIPETRIQSGCFRIYQSERV